MDLTLREAATLLSRSERTLRAQLQRGELRGRKSGRQWLVQSDDLPLTAERRRELARRADLAHEAVEATLPRPVREARRARSLGEQAFFTRALELHQALETAAEPAGRARSALEAGLIELAYAHVEFEPALRLASLRAVRRAWSQALAALLLARPAAPELVGRAIETLEQELLPRLGGLLRWTDERARSRGREA
jgi:excisionase family DNA binding protein